MTDDTRPRLSELPAGSSLALFSKPLWGETVMQRLRVLGVSVGPVEDHDYIYGLHSATAYLCVRDDGATFWISQRHLRLSQPFAETTDDR